jgi:hypothetical protein
MTPLSTEKLSRGSPAMFHAWILIGSPSVLVNEYSDEHGSFLSLNTFTKHALVCVINSKEEHEQKRGHLQRFNFWARRITNLIHSRTKRINSNT